MELDKLVEKKRISFRNELKTDYYRNPDTEFDTANLSIFVQAVKDGYGDAKRTFTKIGEFWKDKDKEKEKFFETVAKSIQSTFSGDPVEEKWHHKLCDDFCKNLAGLGYKHNDKTVTYGQAQKVINMAFKYLFCLNGAEKHPLFKECHMPLDSYTLSWYRKNIKNPKIKSDDAWSGLNQEQYEGIQDAIRKHLESDRQIIIDEQTYTLPKEPLFAEFIIWPEEILLRAGNAFLQTINPDHRKVDLDSMKLMKEILREYLPKYCNLEIQISEKS